MVPRESQLTVKSVFLYERVQNMAASEDQHTNTLKPEIWRKIEVHNL